MRAGLPDWDTSCVDWAERLVTKRSIIPPPIFEDQAELALSIFKRLRVSDLPGKPTFGECAEQWVFDFVAAIFGAYDAETGDQLIREFYLLISKKNTKSTIAAGIMLTAVIICWREDEEHLILAPTKEVADNSFKPAAGMVRADEELSALFQIQDHIRTITHRVSRSSLKVVAADTDTVSGKKAGRVMIDEHWLFGTRANAEAMFMEATGGQVSRNEGWIIYLTTQSDAPPAGVFKDKLQYYRDVRDGKIIDKKSLGVLYEFPKSMMESKAYLDPANFYVTNPNIGKSVSAEWIADNLKKNQAKTDGTFQQFLAKHLNIEIGMRLRNDNWPGAEFWDKCKIESGLTLEQLLAQSDVVTVGVDGGGLDDLLGLTVLGRHNETGKWLHWAHAWVHPIGLERRKGETERYNDFVREGTLTIVSEMGQDVRELADIVEQIEQSELLDQVGVDAAGIGAIVEEITNRGIEFERIVAIPQGYRLMGAIKTFERKLAAGEIAHQGSLLMNWVVSNARIEQRGNSILVTKQVSGSAKIDPLLSSFSAVALMILNPKSRAKKYQMYFV